MVDQDVAQEAADVPFPLQPRVVGAVGIEVGVANRPVGILLVDDPGLIGVAEEQRNPTQRLRPG